MMGRSLGSPVRPSMLALGGSAVILLAIAAYSYVLSLVSLPTPESVAATVPAAEAYFVLVLVGLGLVGFGARLELRQRIEAIRTRGEALLSPGWAVPYVLSLGRYRRAFFLSSVLYGIFYAFLTSMVVYQPSVDFVSAYGAVIPSLTVTPIQGAPLFTPVVTAYLTDHVGVLLIPLTVMLALGISALVGVNVALAAFALDSRAKGGGRGWVAGVGAVVGLFTGCPTCAGLFFANVLGGSGAVSFATILGYYQPAFILLSLPVLLATPYLTSRSLSKVYREGCVVLARPTRT
jgi:hypothetical protein